jgi:superfamily I DNA/RNA helicase
VPLPEPKGKQREVVTLNHFGHSVVLGTAGSGKTTMAIHRAAYLANSDTMHHGPTLLLSFNKSLLAYLNYLRPPELTGVDIRNYHHFARGYLNDRDRMGFNWICDKDPDREIFIGQALEATRKKAPKKAVLKRPLQFFVTETRWMAQQGITSLDEYLEINRVGRGDEGALGAKQRELVFEVFESYRLIREEAGFQYDWYDIATTVCEELEKDERPRKYRHIVIDEGQDFSPSMLRSLALLIPPEGSLTFFGDVAQQVYGRRISWREAGLTIKAPWIFERNYRNSPQIARVGIAIAEMPYFADELDMVPPTEFAAEGPKPTLVRCDSRAEEVELAIEQAKAASESASVAVLVRRREDLGPFTRAFRNNGRRLYRDMTHWSPDPGVSYGTVHNAKGYEFDTVILVGLSDSRWPDPGAIEAEGLDEAVASDGRLLYVGVTRARSALIMIHSDEATKLLPPNKNLWTEAGSPTLFAEK